MQAKRFFLWPAVLCSVAFVLCIWIARPVLAMGGNDDWSYAFSARVLADTGHVVYNGWATAMLGWQLYWGALFIRTFGFSFTILRISTLILSVCSLALLQRIFVRVGLSVWNSTIATLGVAFSPVFFVLGFSFMSDIAGLFSLLVCLYLCIRAIQSSSDRESIRWLAIAALSNVVLGTVRQTSWLGALVLVPSAALCLRRRRSVAVAGGALWCVSVPLILACMHWFSVQPYSLVEKFFAPLPGTTLESTLGVCVRCLLSLCFYLLPVLAAFIARFPHRIPLVRAMVVGAAGGVLLGIKLHILDLQRGGFWLWPFTQNEFTEKGFNDFQAALGERASIFSDSQRAALSILIFATLASVMACVVSAWSFRRIAAEAVEANCSAKSGLSWSDLTMLLGPFSVTYFILIVTRPFLWDRYLLVLMPVALIFLVRFFQERLRSRLHGFTLVALLVFAIFDTAALHDYFAQGRARLQAAAQLQGLGIPREQINAGFEFSAWTQLELAGYVNDKRLRTPAGAYQPQVRPANLRKECDLYFSDHTPRVLGRYAISYSPTSCLVAVPGASPVHYETWLGPHDQAIYSGALAR